MLLEGSHALSTLNFAVSIIRPLVMQLMVTIFSVQTALNVRRGVTDESTAQSADMRAGRKRLRV